jgi:hypothetical protein
LDPTSVLAPTFADTTARDAFVTANGGTAALPAGFMCVVLTVTRAIHVWDGAAWKTVDLA